MGTFIEPLLIQGINRDVAPGALDYAGRRVLNPVRDVLNARYLTSEGEQAGKVEHIKGTEVIEDDYSIFQAVMENSEFTGTLDPWLQLADGDLAFTYASNRARVSSSASGTLRSNTLYQLNTLGDLKAGETSNFRLAVNKGNFSEVNVYGDFLDSGLNIISTFFIGRVFLPQDNLVTIVKVIPSGAKHFAFHLSCEGVGVASTATVDYCRIEAPILFSLPAGLNKCIASYENVEKNSLFFWLWNSNGYNGVFKIDGSSYLITQILADTPENIVLDFHPDHVITGIGMIGDILTWTEPRKPQRYCNVTREYPTLNDQLISLAKIGPKNAPTFTTRATDAGVTFNKLSSDSFQFAYQYVYQDNEISVLSPYSKLCSGDILPDVATTSRAKIQVTHTVDSVVTSLVKEVRLLYRKNNEPNWYVWKKVTSFSSSIAEYFFNNEQGTLVPEAQSTKLFDQVPNKSKALTIFRGRIFLNINEEGFDFVPPTIVASVSADVNLDAATDILAKNTQSRGAFLKKNGSYLAGIFFRDHLGRLSGISSKASVTGPKLNITSTFDINATLGSIDALNRKVNKLNITLSGVGPANCEYFIALTKEQNYAQYMQVPAHLLLYVGEDEGDDEVAALFELIRPSNTQRHYQKLISSTRYNYLHFLLPQQLPFVPDKDCFVRFASDTVTQVERVLDVIDGDIIVTSNFGTNNWTFKANGVKNVPLIEIFKPNAIVDPFFYQVKGPYTTDSAGNLQTTIISDIDADTYDLYLQQFKFKPYSLSSFEKIGALVRQNILLSQWIFIESPSPIAKSTVVNSVNLIPERPVPADFLTSIAPINGLSPDHTKVAWSKGWPVVEVKPLLQQRPATLRFSDPYIEGSEINGLNNFPVGNVYDKIGQDRSPITKLLAVGNVLVAVHERHVTSIYVGEGIVRTGETGFITKVENVVGDDRKLNGEWGSYHPESVQEIDGQAFGYDIYSGCVWRYTVEGLIAVSDFGLMNHFKERSEKYFPYRDQLKFVSSVDRYHKEYLITLPHLYLNKETVALQSASGSLQYDFVLNPANYVSGQTYRIKLVPFNQASGTEHRFTLNAYFDNDPEEVIAEDVKPLVTTSSEDEAEAVYLEFLYEGQGYVSLVFTNVTTDIYARISSEYQELTGETWAYNYKAKLWAQRYSFVPDYMGKIGTDVILFKDGTVYKHSVSDTHNNFFGLQYNSKIHIAANPQPGKDKTWSALQIDREVLAVDTTLKVVEVSNDHGQASYTRAKEFNKENGVYSASIFKDVNTNPLLLPAGTIALRDGKDMRSKTLDIVINNDSTGAARLQKLNVLGEFSEFSA